MISSSSTSTKKNKMHIPSQQQQQQYNRRKTAVLIVVAETEREETVVSFFIQLWNSLFTRKQNAREWKKAVVGISHQTGNQKEYVGVRIRYIYTPFVVALDAGVNSNLSSRDRFFLTMANPRQHPNSCVHGWHEACCRTQETRPGAWSSSVQTDGRAWANHILPKPSIIFRTG